MKASFILFQALLAATGVNAQEVLAEILAYNSGECGDNPNDPDLISSRIVVLKDAELTVNDGTPNGACTKQTWSVPGWPKNSGGDYDIHIDNNDVPEGCELVLYKDLPAGSGTSGQNICATFYRRVPHKRGCTTTTMGEEFGFAMCCGEENCSFAGQSNPFEKKSKRAVDVAAVKRSPLMRRQDDCKFAAKDGSTKTSTKYGEQTKISNTINCPGSEGKDCLIETGVEYSVSVTNSFGVEAGIEAQLFKALSASLSFSYEWSEEKGTSFSETMQVPVTPGASGYMSFQAELECSPDGDFEDCDGDLGGKSGSACFPVYIGEKPSGIFTFVQTN